MRHIAIIVALGTVVNLFATEDLIKKDSVPVDPDFVEVLSEAEEFGDRLDEMVSDWYAATAFSYYDTAQAEFTDDASIPDSVFIQRLKRLSEETVMELPYNNIVKAHIEVYTKRKRELTSEILGMTDYYFPMFEEELDKAGMPIELKYMAVIESALKPRAFSRAGASGLWQFMYYTGKQYNLNVNSYVDERRDPLKSTVAAIAFLRDLYAIYNDWYLVIAAYNCGPGNVNKAIRRTGGKRDYWEIYYYLPRETRGYVPAFIAAMYTLNYYKEHNIVPLQANLPQFTDTLMVQEPLHFEQVASVLGISTDVIRALNPQYRRDVIPGGSKNYALTIPVEYTSRFIDMQDSIFNYNIAYYFNEKRTTVDPSSGSTYYPSSIAGKSKVYYTVKSGDNLGYIADWYNVRLSDLRYWNNISRNLIRVGQRLSVFVPSNEKERYENINNMSFAEKQRKAGVKTTSPVAGNVSQTVSVSAADSDYIYYQVRSGDNLWTIARRFPGISSEDIKRLNKLTSNSISPGQMLKIKPKS